MDKGVTSKSFVAAAARLRTGLPVCTSATAAEGSAVADFPLKIGGGT